MEEIIIGKPKYEFDHFYKDRMRIELSRKFAEIEDIELWVEKKSLQNGVETPIQVRLIVDEYIKFRAIKPIIVELKRNGIKEIYLTCIKEYYNGFNESMFEYISIEKLDFEKEIALKTIIR